LNDKCEVERTFHLLATTFSKTNWHNWRYSIHCAEKKVISVAWLYKPLKYQLIEWCLSWKWFLWKPQSFLFIKAAFPV